MRVSSGLRSAVALFLLSCGGGATLDDPASHAAALGEGGATLCDPGRFPTYRPDPAACCRDGVTEWFIFGGSPAILIRRIEGNPCTSDGVAGACIGRCAYGPCGAAQTTDLYNPPAHIFHPLSDPTVCGLQATGLPGQPEEWTPEHVSYPGVAATCLFNSCGPNGPALAVAVTAAADGATGHVESEPQGIELEGAGQAQWSFDTTAIRVRAKAQGRHARARFSGGCVGTSDYGKQVVCEQLQRVILPAPLTGPLAITVTYECEPGFNCKNGG